jgi:ABC-type transport system involved in multi-copper enzyme maturation permease subunit
MLPVDNWPINNMKYLFLLEWKKVKYSKLFLRTILLFCLFLPLLFYTVQSATKPAAKTQFDLIAPLYKFPLIWESMFYWSSWLSFFLLIYLVVWSFSSEMEQKTERQNVINGLSKRHYFMAKLIYILSLSLFFTAYTFCTCYVIGKITGGNGNTWGTEYRIAFRYFLQCLFYSSFVMLIVHLVRKGGLSLIIFYAYTMMVERVFRYLIFKNLLDDLKLGSYFPASISWDLVPFYMYKRIPNYDNSIEKILLEPELTIPVSLAYTLICVGLSYWIFSKRDL